VNGEVGSYIKAAVAGMPVARQHVQKIFGKKYQTWDGWMEILRYANGSDVNVLLNRHGSQWTREAFQALYVACWIHHPVEKGSFMLQMTNKAQLANMTIAYKRLQETRDLQPRISSHLAGKGVSAHVGWDFLKGYEELLIQMEQEPQPYLFLKCEGEALSGFSLGTIIHLADWVKKEVTGAGSTFNHDLNAWSDFSAGVEGRAAENYSPEYQKLLKQLGLTDKRTTVAQVVEKLNHSLFGQSFPTNLKNDTHALAQAMLGAFGYLAKFRQDKGILKKKGIDFSPGAEAELTSLATRMLATKSTHTGQVYNEIRVTPSELNQSLLRFWSYL